MYVCFHDFWLFERKNTSSTHYKFTSNKFTINGLPRIFVTTIRTTVWSGIACKLHLNSRVRQFNNFSMCSHARIVHSSEVFTFLYLNSGSCGHRATSLSAIYFILFTLYYRGLIYISTLLILHLHFIMNCTHLHSQIQKRLMNTNFTHPHTHTHAQIYIYIYIFLYYLFY